MEGWWNSRPEWLSWLLFVPLLFGIPLVVYLILLFTMATVGPGPGLGVVYVFAVKILAPIVVASVMAPLSFELVYLLAPRGRRALLWLVYVPLAALCGIVFLVLLGRRLATWGLLGAAMLPSGNELGWQTADWGELGQSVAWLIAGTASFRSCLQRAAHPLVAGPIHEDDA